MKGHVFGVCGETRRLVLVHDVKSAYSCRLRKAGTNVSRGFRIRVQVGRLAEWVLDASSCLI
jgi:hypothetical protein